MSSLDGALYGRRRFSRDPEKTAEEAQEEIGAATSQMPDLEAEDPATVAVDDDQAKAEAEAKAKEEANA